MCRPCNFKKTDLFPKKLEKKGALGDPRYICVCVCMYFLEGGGEVGERESSAGSKQGSISQT